MIRCLIGCAVLGLAGATALAQPANDSCDSPSVIPVEGGVIDVPYQGATADPQVQSCAGPVPLVWYSYTAPKAGRINLTTCESTTYNVLSIWSDCGVEARCSYQNSACPGDGSSAFFGLPVAAGERLLIAVGTYPFFTGHTYLNVTPFLGDPPPNDDCSGAIDIVDGVTEISNGTATDAGGPVSCASPFAQASGDVWYRYTASCTGFASVAFQRGSLRYAMLEVFNGCGGESMGCNNGFNGETRVTWSALAGESFIIRVAGYWGNYQDSAYGAGTLTAGCFQAAANDLCENAQAVTLGLTPFDTRYAHTDWSAPSCVDADANDVFFSFTPDEDTYVYAMTGYGNPGDSGIHVSLSVYDACGGNMIECDDQDGNELPSFEWYAVGGTTYIIRAASLVTQPGSGALFLRPVAFPAPNDECSGAVAVGEGTTIFDTTRFEAGAYTSPDPLYCYGNPFPGGQESPFNNDLWFSYTATQTGRLSVTVSSQNFVAEIYDGCGGSPAACTLMYAILPDGHDGSEACFDAAEGATYIIRVGQDFFTGGGVGRLIIEPLGNPVFVTPKDAVPEKEVCDWMIDMNGGCVDGGEEILYEEAALCSAVSGTLFYNPETGMADADFFSVPLEFGRSYVLEGQSIEPVFIAIGGVGVLLPRAGRAGAAPDRRELPHRLLARVHREPEGGPVLRVGDQRERQGRVHGIEPVLVPRARVGGVLRGVLPRGLQRERRYRFAGLLRLPERVLQPAGAGGLQPRRADQLAGLLRLPDGVLRWMPVR